MADLDTAVVNESAYHLTFVDGIPHLALRRGASHTKRFPLDLDADPWEHALVATDAERIVGFMATSHRAWNRQLVLHHLYVDRPARGRGIGRALMDEAVVEARAQGARTLWVETSSRNPVGVAVYERMGFRVCGFDGSMYLGTDHPDEFPIFLARDMGAAAREPTPHSP